MKKHFLFICNANMKAGVARDLFENSEHIEARSAAIYPFQDKDKITTELIRWAGIIFVMNNKKEFQKDLLSKQFPEIEDKEVVDLNINPEVRWDDPELKERLKERLKNYL